MRCDFVHTMGRKPCKGVRGRACVFGKYGKPMRVAGTAKCPFCDPDQVPALAGDPRRAPLLRRAINNMSEEIRAEAREIFPDGLRAGFFEEATGKRRKSSGSDNVRRRPSAPMSNAVRLHHLVAGWLNLENVDHEALGVVWPKDDAVELIARIDHHAEE